MIIAFLVVALCVSFAVTGVVVYLNWAAGRVLLAVCRHEADPEFAAAQLSLLLGPALRGQAVLFDEGGRASLRYTSDVLEQRFGVTASQGLTLPTSQVAGVARANLLELFSRSRSDDARAAQELGNVLALLAEVNSEGTLALLTERVSLFAAMHVRVLLHRAIRGDAHALAAVERLGELLKQQVTS